MKRQVQEERFRDWYSISVFAIRRWIIVAALLLVAAAGWLVFKQWQLSDLQQRAVQTIDQATRLSDELRRRDDYPALRQENGIAWDRLEAARNALVNGSYNDAYNNGRQSLSALKAILDIDGDRQGSIRFLSVQGSVEYRRGERGAWKRAREQDSLDGGDWVKTGRDGTAELVFADNTTYLLRPETMVHLGATAEPGNVRQAPQNTTNIYFGWVELTTAQRSNAVSTPRSRAEIQSRSEASVSYDRSRDRARIAAFKGRVEVRSETGEQRSLNSLQQVEQVGDRLGAARSLPGRPILDTPADDREIDLDTRDRVALAWQPVAEAKRYWLRVSTGRLFATMVVEDPDRRKTRATLGLRREGSFYWQVAARSAAGDRGPWSETRVFRVAALQTAGLAVDREPPPLEVRDMQPFGTLVIVRGRTEPGAKVTVNGEPAVVSSDGAFNKAVQMTQDGWASVVVVATDAAGNLSRHRGRVHIDVF